MDNRLIGSADSKTRRIKLGKLLNIGYANGTQLLQRLNNYGIEREEFSQAMNALDKTNE